INGSTTHFYTVEARRLAGYDQLVPAAAVVIHDVDTTRSGSKALVVDPDGNGDPNDAGAEWIPGETFSDAASGIQVAVVAADGARCAVAIANQDGNARGIAVTSPAGGAQWSAGTTQTVRWTSLNIAADVKIDLSRDAGASWSSLIA